LAGLSTLGPVSPFRKPLWAKSFGRRKAKASPTKKTNIEGEIEIVNSEKALRKRGWLTRYFTGQNRKTRGRGIGFKALNEASEIFRRL
jgi:hypothetical protein